jgi:alpha-L-fucosidase
MGEWMKVNSEAIYETTSTKKYKEGDVKFTLSKNGQCVYAIATKPVNGKLVLSSITVKKGSKMYMLGIKKPLKYTIHDNETISIDWPSSLPCNYAWTIKIEGSPKG